MAKNSELTPMMKQFMEMKSKHPDAVLLFRVGDFYETYLQDAITASEILGITLTRRSNGGAESTEMAGFPHHALDTYLPKLVRAGKRVAICDQLEDPKLTKKLVKRGITELVTPGVVVGGNILDRKENNFLASVHFGKKLVGVSFLDISTGEFLVAEGEVDYIDKLLCNFSPKEVLIDRSMRQRFQEAFSSHYLTFEMDDWVFTCEAATDRLLRHFETRNLKGFGVDGMNHAIVAAGAVLHYLDLTQHTQVKHISTLARIEAFRALGVSYGRHRLLARSDGASGDVHYFTRARYPGTPFSQLPQSSFYDRDERTGSYNPESESADIVRAVILLMGGAAAENIVLKKWTKDGSTRFAEGKEIVEFGFDIRYAKEMPLRIRLCSVRGTLGWPDLSKTDENLARCFDFYLGKYADVAASYARRHPVMHPDDVADAFWEGFAARTRVLHWNYMGRREQFDSFAPRLFGDYRFGEKWSFALWALEKQRERLPELGELFRMKFQAACDGA